MATLDATTQAEYAAEINAADRAQAIIDALADPVYGRVYNADDLLMGEGTMTSPWATISADDNLITSTLDGFFVSAVDEVNDGWSFRFESGSRYVEFTFGLSGSGKEATWNLSSWDLGSRAGISDGEIVVAGNRAPVWSGAPTEISVEAGTTISLSSYVSDPDGDPIAYSLVGAASGYSISSSGVLTVGSASHTAVIRATDPDGLYSDLSLIVTVYEVGTGDLIYAENWDSRAAGNVTGPFYDSGVEVWRRNLNGDGTTTYIEMTSTSPIANASQYMHTRMVKSGVTNYRTELTQIRWGRDDMTALGGGQYRAPGDFWYGFRMRINTNEISRALNDTVGGHYCQWHNDDSDPGLLSDKSPPLSLWWNRLGLRVRFESNDDANPLINGVATPRTAGGTYFSPYIFNPLPVGASHDFMWRIRWDTRTRAAGSVGAVDLYVDDDTSPVFTWRGQTCHPYPYTNGNSPYFRFGMYIGYWRSGGWDPSYEGWVMDQSYDEFRLQGNDGSRLGVKPTGAR